MLKSVLTHSGMNWASSGIGIKCGTSMKTYILQTSDGLCLSKDLDWIADNSGDKTHPVATKKPNALGIYDMSGNVWEWCLDWYDADYYSASPVNNPKNTSKGARTRVQRGGGWDDGATYCRVSDRNGYEPTNRYSSDGFRVVSF